MQKLFDKAVLVDDDPISNYVTSQVIRKMELSNEVVVLNNGQEAFDFFRQQSTSRDNSSTSDLVLLDINMALINGFELLEALRYTDYQENLKIVILSSSENPKDVDEAAQYRIHGYITKPLTAEKLHAIFDLSPEGKAS